MPKDFLITFHRSSGEDCRSGSILMDEEASTTSSDIQSVHHMQSCFDTTSRTATIHLEPPIASGHRRHQHWLHPIEPQEEGQAAASLPPLTGPALRPGQHDTVKGWLLLRRPLRRDCQPQEIRDFPYGACRYADLVPARMRKCAFPMT